MNREIKFRGKDLTYGVWRFGDLLQHNDGDVCIGVHDEHWTDDGLHLSFYLQESHVDEDTVGQYTGLKDKNGVEIYEGDIMNDPTSKNVGIVEWNNILTQFQLSWQNMPTAADLFFMLKNGSLVIGNIHDNPELIKGNNHE